MILRSGRKVFKTYEDGNEFLNMYCSISYINNKTILKKKIKVLIKNWYLWLVKKHIETGYLLSPWYLFSVSIFNTYNSLSCFSN